MGRRAGRKTHNSAVRQHSNCGIHQQNEIRYPSCRGFVVQSLKNLFIISDMAESRALGQGPECGLQPHFQKQTGPVLQEEPDSSMTTPPTTTVDMATYLDSDSDDSDHIHYEGEQEEE